MNAATSTRPRLVLLLARYGYRPKNVVAATLAWMAEHTGAYFDVYYDAIRAGRHYGGGSPGPFGFLTDNGQELELLTGGLVAGGRHLEALATVLQRFQTTVLCVGEVAFSNTLAAIADDSGADVHTANEHDLPGLYDSAFSALELPLPTTAVMVDGAPTITSSAVTVRGRVEGIDAAGFASAAEEAVAGCPVSRALLGNVEVTLDAALV